MFRNKFLAALAAFTLAGGALAGIAGPALADDESTSTETTPVESPVVPEPPTAEPVAVEPVAPEPVAPEPVVPEPVVPEPVVPEPVAPEPVAPEPAPAAPEGVVPEPAVPEPAVPEPAAPELVAPDQIGTEEAATEESSEPSPTAVIEESPAMKFFAPELLIAAEPLKKVQFCHATGDESNPYSFLDTSVSAFFNSGHHEHQNFEDIVQPFSYVKQGVTIDFPGLNWDAEGQAIFFNGCNEVIIVAGVATAGIFFTDASCTAAEQLVLGTVTNATWGPVTDPAGDEEYTVTAFADANSFFEGGFTELTFHGDLDPLNESEDCDNTLIKKVQFCHATGSEDNPFTPLDISVNAFFNESHDTHQNLEDIIPPFSYIKQGEVIDFPGLNWSLDGQAFFLAGCKDGEVVVFAVATASVSTTPATCTAPELLVLGAAVNATWGPVTDPAGDEDYFVTATADVGALFAGAVTELTFHGDLDPMDDSEDCDNTLVKKVEFCHATGSESHPFQKIETSVNAFFNAGHDTHQNFEDVVPPFSYIKQGEVINFPGLNWDAEGEAFLKAGCKTPPPPVVPLVTFTQATCDADASYTLGAVGGVGADLLTFTVNGTAGILAGTYPTTADSVTVTVQAVEPAVIDPGWANPPPFDVVPAAGCIVPASLAFTGVAGLTGLLGLGGGLLFLGIVALFMRRNHTTVG